MPSCRGRCARRCRESRVHLVSLPRNHRAQGPASVGEVLLKEFAKQPLVGAQRRPVERAHQRLLREFLEEHLTDGGRPLRAMVAWERHLSLIHISEPTRRTPISYAVF